MSDRVWVYGPAPIRRLLAPTPGRPGPVVGARTSCGQRGRARRQSDACADRPRRGDLGRRSHRRDVRRCLLRRGGSAGSAPRGRAVRNPGVCFRGYGHGHRGSAHCRTTSVGMHHVRASMPRRCDLLSSARAKLGARLWRLCDLGPCSVLFPFALRWGARPHTASASFLTSRHAPKRSFHYSVQALSRVYRFAADAPAPEYNRVEIHSPSSIRRWRARLVGTAARLSNVSVGSRRQSNAARRGISRGRSSPIRAEDRYCGAICAANNCPPSIR